MGRAESPWREDRSVAAEIYFNVAVSGLLTGLVYGLMAVGLSVIFGVVRVVNFAHGEMMTIAMYLAIVLFSSLGLDPLVMVVPLAGVLFPPGHPLPAGHHQSVHHPARAQPVHLAGRGRDHHRQRPSDRVRARCPQRPDVLCVR